MLLLYTANRYEELRAHLLDKLGGAVSADPFASHPIIVPGMAIRRDLQLAIARQQGVCMGVEFAFLGQWLWTVLSQLVAVPDVSPFAPQRLSWRLYRILSDPAFVAAHPRLQHFLDQADPVLRLDLASRIADLFEQMVTYRPEWLDDWRAGRSARPGVDLGKDESWQAALWLRISRELGISREHPASAFLSAWETIPETAQRLAAAKLPPRLDVFALPSLPPQYLRLLHRLSADMEICLYLLNPCAEYWFEVVDKKRLTRLHSTGQAAGHEVGNALLAAWGQQTQAQLALVYGSDTVVEVAAEVRDHPDTLLGRVQNAILHLRPLTPMDKPAAGDRSLEIHVCHALIRELEVLHDRLLTLSQELPDFSADQILVAVPDLETAAPLIDAVFGARGGLPYHITGRSQARENPVARALLAVLDASFSRMTASDGLALLREPLIAARFRLDENDVEALATALQTAGLHWGLEQNTPGGEGGLAHRHGWRDALSRLLLAYAVGNEPVSRPYQGILPAPTGINHRLLGRLGRFLDALEKLRSQVAEALPAQGWLKVWQGAMESLLIIDNDVLEEAQTVRKTLQTLAGEMTEGEGEVEGAGVTRFPPAVAHAALLNALDTLPRGGIPGGAVTFAALPSLRGLPYRVVCLLGLNDGQFPSPRRPPEFDLLAQNFRPGDRQRRLDERTLFLDLLLSAREFLHLSYTGRSQRDDSPMPPSVLVSALMDELLPLLGETGISRLCVEHPLQAFSPRYAKAGRDPRLTTFQPWPWKMASRQEKTAIPPLFTRSLAAPGEAWQKPGLDDIQRFFRHPARFLLRDRLGIRLPSREEDMLDEEPLTLSAPDTWPLTRRLLSLELAAPVPSIPPDLSALALASSEVPVGSIGKAQVRPLLSAVSDFASRLRPLLESPCSEAGPVQVLGEKIPLGLRLFLSDVRPHGLIRYRLAPLSATDIIAAWLDHLALCTLAPAGVALRTEHLGRETDGKIVRCVFQPVQEPQILWQDWLEAYWQGLQEVLVFPPRTAWEMQQETAKGKTLSSSSAWLNDWQQSGEALDPWWQLALRGKLEDNNLLGSPLSKELKHWCAVLLAPMKASLEQEDSDA